MAVKSHSFLIKKWSILINHTCTRLPNDKKSFPVEPFPADMKLNGLMRRSAINHLFGEFHRVELHTPVSQPRTLSWMLISNVNLCLLAKLFCWGAIDDSIVVCGQFYPLLQTCRYPLNTVGSFELECIGCSSFGAKHLLIRNERNLGKGNLPKINEHEVTNLK